MKSVAQRILDAVRRGGVDASLLEAAGFDEPAALADAVALAANDEQLGAAMELWLPPLVASAQPAFGVRALHQLVAMRRELGHPVELRDVPALAPLLGASRFLARRLIAHPDWIDALAGAPPEAPSTDAIGRDWEAVRSAKYRGLLRVVARDLLGRPFEASLRELSDLADRCLVAALGCAEEQTECEAPALLALGKLGGRELNFSSDVDLLFIYDVSAGSDPLLRAEAVTRLVRLFKANLERPTGEGFGYRVDLDLRPEGRSGVLANPVDTALAYYERFGADWERQMLIRLRSVTKPSAVQQHFVEGIRPFVYRKRVGPDLMRAVHGMKLRIEAERRAAGQDLESCLKEGPGGIRDVEFLVQALQLLHGAKHPTLRSGHVPDTLTVLGELELLPEPTVHTLRDAYLWLRRAEHALQLAEEQQTSRVPRERGAQIALARRMGHDDASGDAARSRLLDDWSAVRAEVRGHFDRLLLRDPE